MTALQERTGEGVPAQLPPVLVEFGSRSRRAVGDLTGLLLTAPALAALACVFVAPVAYAFYLGFTNLTLTGPQSVHYNFTGSANLVALAHDALFWHSLAVTGIYIGGSAVFGVTVAAMVLALWMERAARGVSSVVGGVAILAWIMPAASGAFLWYGFSTQGGTLSRLFGGAPLFSAPLVIVSAANVWSTSGFAMLVLRGGLRAVPPEVLEAARMEGASGWQIFWKVTVPIMRYTLMTTVLIVVLLSLGNFTLIYVLTQGGPGDATAILPIYSYLEAFSFNRLGYGGLIGNVVVVLGAVGAYGYVRAVRRRDRDLESA